MLIVMTIKKRNRPEIYSKNKQNEYSEYIYYCKHKLFGGCNLGF